MASELEMFGLLVFGHVLADYPLQGDFLAKAKNRYAPIAGVPWYQALGAHSAIHAGFVGIITGSMLLALCELIMHYRIDDAKCAEKISYNQDQALHIACKAWWTVLAVWVMK